MKLETTRTRDFWENVYESTLTSLLSRDDNGCRTVLDCGTLAAAAADQAVKALERRCPTRGWRDVFVPEESEPGER